jgi:twitching motility protein PilT
MRIASDLLPTELPAMEDSDLETMLVAVLGREGLRRLREDCEMDASYELPDLARFRVNAFKRMGRLGAAFRLIPISTPTIQVMVLT